MKTRNKLLMMITCMVLGLSTAMTVSAANPAVSITPSASSVKVGDTITYTVSVSGCDSATSAAVNISCGSQFEVVSGQWLKSGTVIANFDASQNKGAMSYSAASSMNGNLFNLTLRAKAVDAAASVSINVQIKNGSTPICDKTTSTSTKITCASHSYGGWTTVANASCTSAGKEQRTCSACGTVETRDTSALGHSWGSYAQTKDPTCTASGTKMRTCSRCNQTESQTIAALGHDFSKLTVTKEPTCTEKGEETGTCKKCGEKVSQAIDATGHSFGDWKQVVAPTFSEAGTEKRVCKECNVEETRSVDALGYEFSEPSSTKEAVFVYYDVTTLLDADNLSEKGYVNARFAIPYGAGTDVTLYYVSENGVLEKVASEISEDGTTLEAQLTKLGTYAICKMIDEDNIAVDTSGMTDGNDTVDKDGDTDNAKKNNSIIWIWIVIGIVVLLTAGSAVIFILYKKKKRTRRTQS